MYAFRRGESFYYEFQFEHRRIRRGGFPTKTLAKLAGDADQRQRREQRIERVWGITADHRRRTMPTLAEYIRDGYTKHHLPRLEPSTQRTARSQLRRLIHHLGRSPLDGLAPAVLDAYVTARLAAVSPSQVREEIARLSRVLNHARARGVLTVHPFKGWKRPKAVPRDYRIITLDEERKLIASAPRDFGDWIALGLDTGLRKGELQHLKSGDVSGSELRIVQPKTKKVKVVPLTPRAQQILKRRMSTNSILPTDPTKFAAYGYVLGQGGGRRYSLPWIDRMWKRALTRAKLSGIRFHDLRHTFASRLASNRVSPPVVGELLGHKAPYITTMRYFHALPEEKRAAISMLPTLRNPPRRQQLARSHRRIG